jgi:hypothetical protein
MHWNTEQILWALVLAAHLVLLIVLLGRDRIQRFPWFTAAITLSTVSLLADHLLSGKLTSLVFYWQSFSTMTLQAIFGIFVLLELARRVFSSGRKGLILKSNGWLGWGFLLVAASAGAVWAWGPWPTLAQLNAQPTIRGILLMRLVAMKSQLFVALLSVEVALLLSLFGRRFGFGLRSHPRQIALGLSTNALCLLILQIVTDLIQRNLHFTTRQEMATGMQRLEHLLANLDNARFALWILVLVWWIYWLWSDEPGAGPALRPAAATAAIEPHPLEISAVPDPEEDGDPEFRD